MISPEEALHAAHDIANFILDQFEQQEVGPIARASIALLTFLRPEDYPKDIAARIIHVYRCAQVSPDDFVRGRVQSPRIQALIEANEE